MNLQLIKSILYITTTIWGAVEVLIVIWMFKAKPNKIITDKYSRKVVFLSRLPLGNSWKKDVEIETSSQWQPTNIG